MINLDNYYCWYAKNHCVYNEVENANFNEIKTLKKNFKCDFGYSSHEFGLAILYVVATLNATSIERHITLERSMYGFDQFASIEPAGFEMLVGIIWKIEKSFGDGKIGSSKEKYNCRET